MRREISTGPQDHVRFVAIISAIYTAGFLGAYASGLHGHFPLPLDSRDLPLGCDFVNTWFYGRAFFDSDPGRFYDRSIYEQALQAALPQNTVTHLWSYPPPFLLLAAPFGGLSYPLALAAWTLFGLVTLGLVVSAQGSRWLTLAVLTSPIAAFSILVGQVALVFAALAIFVFSQLDRRPVLAGLLLSLFVIKPQTIVLVPVLLIASRRWTVLASAAIGALMVVLTSIAVNGVEVWTAFIRLGIPTQARELKDTMAHLAPFSTTITTEAFQAGLPAGAITCLQTLAALTAVGLVAFVGWRGKSGGQVTPQYEGLVVLTCSILVTPYLLIHDLVALSAMILIVTFREGLIKNRLALLVILYMPIIQVGMASLRIHVSAVLVLGLALWLVARLRHPGDKTGRGEDRFAQASPVPAPHAA